MKLDLVYFAWVRERIGKSSETIEVPESVKTVGDLIGHLKISTTRSKAPARSASSRR